MGLEKGDSKNLTAREHRKQNNNIGTHFSIPKNVDKPKVVFLIVASTLSNLPFYLVRHQIC